jgi:hypothetical protein
VVFEALYKNYRQRYNVIKRGLSVKYFMVKNHILASILKIKLNVVNSYQDNLIINTVAVFLGCPRTFMGNIWSICACPLDFYVYWYEKWCYNNISLFE